MKYDKLADSKVYEFSYSVPENLHKHKRFAKHFMVAM